MWRGGGVLCFRRARVCSCSWPLASIPGSRPISVARSVLVSARFCTHDEHVWGRMRKREMGPGAGKGGYNYADSRPTHRKGATNRHRFSMHEHLDTWAGDVELMPARQALIDEAMRYSGEGLGEKVSEGERERKKGG